MYPDGQLGQENLHTAFPSEAHVWEGTLLLTTARKLSSMPHTVRALVIAKVLVRSHLESTTSMLCNINSHVFGMLSILEWAIVKHFS